MQNRGTTETAETHLGQCTLADGRIAGLMPLVFGRWRLGVATPLAWSLGGYDDVW